MITHTFKATVRIDRDDTYGDRVTVRVNGHRWTRDYDPFDNLATLTRRATLDLFTVDRIVSIERDRGVMLGGGIVEAFKVVAA